MKRIEILDRAKEQKIYYKEIGVNPTFGTAYLTSLEAGNDVPDFADVIWNDDIEEILRDCRRFGITEFTISSAFSGIIEAIDKFLEPGCRLNGLTKVKSRFNDRRTGEKEIKPAFKLSL